MQTEPHLAETLQIWYDKGVRAFKFDFAYFNAATRAVEESHLPGEIEEMKPSKASIMPEGLLREMNSQQLRDLFAYLRTTQPLID